MKAILLLWALAGIAGCSPIVPNRSIQISPSMNIALEKLVFWGAYASTAYLILDPLEPNWDIEQASFPDGHYHLALKMKRFYAGGTGESRVVFNQRAKELMREGGYDAYEVLEYSESLESSVLGSQRVAKGVVHLTRNDVALKRRVAAAGVARSGSN